MNACGNRPQESAGGQIAPPFDADEGFRDLPARLRTLAEAHPHSPALIDGDKTLTLGELVALMDSVAAALGLRGVRPGDVVATCASLTADHICTMLGIVARGAAVALLPTSASDEALRRMMENSNASLVLRDDLAPQALQGDSIDILIADARHTTPADPHAISYDTLFAIIYSSGTTGQPKGIEHDALFRDRQIRRLAPFGFGIGAVSLISTPLYSNTTLSGLLPALGMGSTCVILRKFDERDFLELAERHRVTHAMIVPTQARRLLAHPDFDTFDLSAFQVKLSTSAPYTPALLQKLLDRWPGRMINVYGMTEGGVSAMLDAGAYPDKLHTVGRASTGADLRIIDTEGNECAAGEAGEIVGRAPTMMRGYRNAPDITADTVWISREGEAFIRSGDIGRLDTDGFLTLLDRKKDVIISGGFNIYASDIEAVLETHPDVREAAVVGVPDNRWGETPVAFAAGTAAGDPEAIRSWTNERLGKMQRLSGVFIVEKLPRSSIGKILKRELREKWARDDANV